MSYKVRISNINPDFTFDPLPQSAWVDEISNEEALIFLMNRVAVAASQGSPQDYPEIEINWKGKRVYVTALSDGQLLYNDIQSLSQQNLKVIAEEVIRLLEDVPYEQIFLSRDVGDASIPVQLRGGAPSGSKVRLAAIMVMCVTLYICGSIIYKEFTVERSLIETPAFTAEPAKSVDALAAYRGVYVNAFCEGGLLFEITTDGTCSFYEMWNLPNSYEYGLIRMQSLPLGVGHSDGRLAFMAGKLHVLRPLDHQTIQLHNLLYLRHDGPLKSVGKLVTAEVFKE